MQNYVFLQKKKKSSCLKKSKKPFKSMRVAFQLPSLGWFAAINILRKYRGVHFAGQDLILKDAVFAWKL